MALFESYERRINQINETLNKYGISSLEEAEKICKDKGIDCVWNGMTITDEVKNGMNVTDPYVVNAQVIVMAKDKVADYKTVEDLKDLKFVLPYNIWHRFFV